MQGGCLGWAVGRDSLGWAGWEIGRWTDGGTPARGLLLGRCHTFNALYLYLSWCPSYIPPNLQVPRYTLY